jgi:hypothetical protein
MAITLTLTDKQAEILGYALTIAKRREDTMADMMANDGKPAAAASNRDRASRIEELRVMLDTAPVA